MRLSIIWRISRAGFVMGLLSLSLIAQNPEFDLLIKGGRVIDPRNGIDRILDVAVKGAEIAEVAADISPQRAEQVVDAAGFYVTPGLVDLHVHVFYGTDLEGAYSDGYNSLPPDGFTFRNGVTTVVDTGSAGWKNFPQFKRQVIDQSATRVLAFLNIVGAGMKGDPAEQNLLDMNAVLTAQRIQQYPETLVGVKVAHYRSSEWEPVDKAVTAGRLAGVPVMVDFGRVIPHLPLRELFFEHLRRGDIFTHTYAHVPERETIVDSQGRVKDFVFEAQERGIVFDVGHGAGSFVFRQAVPAVRQGLIPNTISTDLHRSSMNAGMKNMLNVMSKFLNMGMSLKEVIQRSTWNPAQVISREDLGHLSPGAGADLAILNLREGDFGFVDVDRKKMEGTLKLECELTLRDGEVVWDLNGISHESWE